MIFMHSNFVRGDKRRCLMMRSVVKKAALPSRKIQQAKFQALHVADAASLRLRGHFGAAGGAGSGMNGFGLQQARGDQYGVMGMGGMMSNNGSMFAGAAPLFSQQAAGNGQASYSYASAFASNQCRTADGMPMNSIMREGAGPSSLSMLNGMLGGRFPQAQGSSALRMFEMTENRQQELQQQRQMTEQVEQMKQMTRMGVFGDGREGPSIAAQTSPPLNHTDPQAGSSSNHDKITKMNHTSITYRNSTITA